ncbi:hypothetical protein BgAZ_205250 [Babesia gibsoni]|uniref:Uncharacterized protein n=1 Tax=Babesia gibsoni TaxID=33632 RepID=A0AAD8LMM0_BABGI|nr:hypothetical protein BgAZ_205250 [Babesia gibsoni]
MDGSGTEENSATLYKVMINKRIVDKVQMSMNTSSGTPCNAAENGVGNMENEHIERNLEGEIEKLREDNRLLEKKYNETFEALDNVRQSALEASERALSREFRIAFLEKALHGCEASLNEVQEQLKEQNKRSHQEKKDMQKEVSIIQSQVENLNNLVRDKDSHILRLVNENARVKNQLNDITQRKSELLKQLKDMCEKLNTVVWETNQREKMLNNLESELKKREIERQSAFLSEVTRSKRLLVNIKVKENMLNQVITTKNQKINELELHVKQLIEKINRISGVFYDINKSGMDVPINSGCYDSNSNFGQVECNIKSPCHMDLYSGRAKLLI